MNLDDTIKYIIWIVFFIIVFGGIYLLLKKLGVM